MNNNTALAAFLVTFAWAALWALGMDADNAVRLLRHQGLAFVAMYATAWMIHGIFAPDFWVMNSEVRRGKHSPGTVIYAVLREHQPDLLSP